MYFVHLYGLHVCCALVDLGSSGSPGVRPTPVLTSSSSKHFDIQKHFDIFISKHFDIQYCNVLTTKVIQRERDNAVYWKTKRKIKDDLQTQRTRWSDVTMLDPGGSVTVTEATRL